MSNDIVVADFDHPAVTALLDLHLRLAHENSPAGHVFARNIDGLRASDVAVWAVWNGDVLVGLGALKELGDGHGEIKSMRTAPGALRLGVGRHMLHHIVAVARERGYHQLSLETGNNEPFEPARRLYEQAGFGQCEPFAMYSDRNFSAYYTLEL